MNLLNLPPYEVQIEVLNERECIYDSIRKKWVALTPEEWVRQHFIHFLLKHLHYPAISITNENRLPNTAKANRTDTVIFGKGGKACMLIEYKAPSLELNKKMWQQLTNYNLSYQAPYIVLTNGLQHIVCHIDHKKQTHSFLKEVPSFERLSQE